MTNDGFTRLASIFVADILKVKYNKDAVPTEKTVSSFTINVNTLDIFIDIPEAENGLFTDFQVIATDLTVYSNKALTFTKTEDALKIKIPFVIVNVAV